MFRTAVTTILGKKVPLMAIRFDMNTVSIRILLKDSNGNYAIYVLEDTSGAPEYESTYTTKYGVAVDEANSEIVYFLEQVVAGN
jgi:hypothetical protein